MTSLAKLSRRSTLGRTFLVAVAVSGCSSGDKRDFVGPPDTTPVDRTISAVVVTPSIVTAQRNEPVDFLAFGRNGKGDSVSASVSWTASGGTVSNTGVFTATSPGRYWVVARSSAQAEKADSASVYITAPENPIVRLSVTPKNLGMKLGQTRQFTATAQLQDGTTANVPVFWSASAGTIGSDGMYTTGDQPGTYLVIGIVASGLTDTAHVTVANTPVLTTMSLTPGIDSLDQGASRQYTVDGQWSDGQSAPPAVDFSVTGGAITSTGVFTAATSPGDYLVTAKQRNGTVTASATVRVKDNLVGVDLSPATIKVAPGSSFQFTVLGKLRNGQSTAIDPNWQATGGSITNKGLYVAGPTPGTYSVIATLSGRTESDTSIVTIAIPTATLTQLVLNPSTVTVGAGGTRQFLVSASWSDGSSTTPAVTWSATGGAVSTAGNYTAGSTPGQFAVIARQQSGTKADTSFVTVTAPVVTSVVLTPATATVVAGTTQQFTVSGSWSDGSVGKPSVSWTSTGGPVSSAGLFTAGSAPGTFLLIAASANGLADTSLVTVTSPAAILQQVVLNPPAVTLQTTGTQQFFVSGVWSDGSSTPPAVTWAATGGSITTNGKFTAGSTAGIFRVIATQQGGTLADTTVVTVTPQAPILNGISLQPATVTLQPGGVQQLTVSGIWSDGGTSSVPVNLSASGGTISTAGLYQAGTTAGTYWVIATQAGGSFADTTKVTITAAPPQLVGLSVTPDSASVTVGSTQKYSVTGLWTNGGSGTPAVSWSTTGGSIAADGVYTPSAAGTYRVVATQQGGTLADTVVVFASTAGPTLTQMKVTPVNRTFQTGTQVKYTVEVQWSSSTTATPPLTWSSTGGTISAAGIYTAGSVPGIYKVAAQEQGGAALTDSTTVTLSAPYVTNVVMTPATASIGTGSTQQFQVAATWSDGVSRPAGVVFSATGGTVSVDGLYTAGSVAGTYSVISTCSCGKADTSTVVVSQGAVTPPTVTSLTLSPPSVTLSPSGTQQFGVTALWSDGSTTVPNVTFTASGGAITSAGAYTAPSTTGVYRVIVNEVGGNHADTSDVTVQPGGTTSGGLTPWLEENFTAYSNRTQMISDILGIYSVGEDVNTSLIDLDQTEGCGVLCGVPAGQPTQSMKYNIPDRTNDPNICHDYTIGRNITLPSPTTEVWSEVWAKFSSNFATVVPGGQCTSGSAYKFVMFRVPISSRFQLVLGIYGQEVTFGYPDNEAVYTGPPMAASYFDGKWHRWRFHYKVGTSGIAVAYLDNTKIAEYRNVLVNRANIYGIALSRNMNQGPTQPMSLNYGVIRAWKSDPGWGW